MRFDEVPNDDEAYRRMEFEFGLAVVRPLMVVQIVDTPVQQSPWWQPWPRRVAIILGAVAYIPAVALFCILLGLPAAVAMALGMLLGPAVLVLWR